MASCRIRIGLRRVPEFRLSEQDGTGHPWSLGSLGLLFRGLQPVKQHTAQNIDGVK